jgi:succinate dehydrogenase / fumarate reductase iron-sulfur subunit
MNLTLKVWRQPNAKDPGRFETYETRDILPDMSFLEMLDVVNERLIERGNDPIAFDSDCREGICGTCSLMINGYAHGGLQGTTACQLHMRHFHDGQTITIEPWRAKPFPVVKDPGGDVQVPILVDPFHADVLIRVGGHERKVSNAENLVVFSEFRQRRADPVGLLPREVESAPGSRR